jgi:hypothetical protein
MATRFRFAGSTRRRRRRSAAFSSAVAPRFGLFGVDGDGIDGRGSGGTGFIELYVRIALFWSRDFEFIVGS